MTQPPAVDPAEITRLLEHGQFDQAEPAVASLIAAEPADAASWFLQARLLEARGDVSAALTACERALALWPDILPVYALLSRLGGQAGEPISEAVALGLRMLLAQQPNDAALAGRIGQNLCGQRRFADALPYLRVGARGNDDAGRSLACYAHALAATGGYRELLDIEPMLTAAAAAENTDAAASLVHLAAGRLALREECQATCDAIALRQGSPAWLDAVTVGEQLQAAITDHAPFSILRLAEADARLFAYASPKMHLSLGEAELSAVVNSVWHPAFGAPIETHGAVALGTLSRDLLAAIDEADIIAMPDAACLSAARADIGFLAPMQQAALDRGSRFCAGPNVIVELHDLMPFLRPLLADQPFLGFVGSYPDLAEKLARFCQVGETATYLVPGALNRGDLAESLRGSDHYPALFEQILTSLVVPFQGAVFLVAAGLLGPAYCGRIKRLGGIAIDIDALVGRWMPV